MDLKNELILVSQKLEIQILDIQMELLNIKEGEEEILLSEFYSLFKSYTEIKDLIKRIEERIIL